MKKSAVISPCGNYRYWLEREWNPDLPKVAFLMLNPSTADGREDDPTIRRCIGFAKSWGYGGFVVVNLFAVRSADPSILKDHDDPVGKSNDSWVRHAIEVSDEVVCAWGSHKFAFDRACEVLAMMKGARTVALKVTKGGSPGHPLYIKADASRVPYWPGK